MRQNNQNNDVFQEFPKEESIKNEEHSSEPNLHDEHNIDPNTVPEQPSMNETDHQKDDDSPDLGELLLSWLMEIFSKCVDVAQTKSRKSLPLFQKAMNDIRKEAGVLTDGILAALVNGYGLINEHEVKQLAEVSDISNKVIKWALESFIKLTKQKPQSKEELTTYIFKLLTIEYRCINVQETVEVPVDLQSGMRNEIIIAFKLYAIE